MMIKKGRKTQEEPVYTGPSVSELLKTTRERTGQDLQTVAQVLRIRFVYLEAIEDGRYEDLPGKTYVVGFVRAYSEHLGLDAEEVVKQFKDEISGLEGKAELVFPSPVTEQSVPGGAIILIGLIILGAAYGGWYFLSSQDRSMAELVPDLPAKFAEMVDNVKNNKKEETSEPVGESEETAETETPTAVTPVSEEDTQDMAQKAMAAVEKAEEEAEEVVQTVETVKVEDVVEEKTEEAAEVVEEATEEKKEEVSETVETAVEEEKQEVAEKIEIVAETVEEKIEETTQAVKEKTEEIAAVVEEVTEEVAAEEETAPAEPQVMTEKIVLKSTYYSWIQVVNDVGTVLHTQVLKENEKYQIPATHGLILRTGNAGGLEIYVDGKKAPSIGEAGEVRRKVLMDPDKLLSGSAVES